MNREIRRPALGKTVSLGCLYDAKTDNFLERSLIKEGTPPTVFSRQVLPTTIIEAGHQDGFNDKFKQLKIDCDFGASILSGFVPLDGPGRFIHLKSEDPPQLQAAVYHTVTTVQDRLELNSLELRGNIALSSLDTSEATHILVEAQYGTQTIIVANRWLRPDEEREVIEPRFKANLDDFVYSLRNRHPYKPRRSSDCFEQVVVYGTTSENAELVLDGLEEARTYLDLLPAQMRTKGAGEGVPIMYRLIPVKMLDLVGLLRVAGSEVSTGASPECLKKIFDVFDAFKICRRRLRDHERSISMYKQYTDPTTLSNLIARVDDVKYAEAALESEFTQLILNIRRGRSDPGELWQVLRKFSEGELAPENLASVSQVGVSQEKMDFINKATRKGAAYFGYGTPDVDRTLRQNNKQTAYVLFFNTAAMQDHASWKANEDVFMRILQDLPGNAFTAIVDCDATGYSLQKAVITQFEDGQEVVNDLLEEQDYLSQHCFGRYLPGSLETDDIKRPLDRRFVKITCPGSNCGSDSVRDWCCSECHAPLEYGFSDQYIYCDCGRALYDTYEFKCNQDTHGSRYTSCDQPQLLACLNSLDQSNYLNILVLGETGVGKSTFINAFVNYLYFKSLDDALQNEELNWVIPCSFATQTMDRSNPGSPIIQNKIQVGTRDDERDGTTGQSATQQTQVYPITVGSWTYRLIDTPGIGDTRGREFDKQNMTDILTTVSGYDYLHGILILLKSNSARLTVHFAFCVKELLTHLHRDATNNVVWGFTNTRISNYMPGDTYGSLTTLLNERPDIGLTLASNSVYCFDSESFRYLAAAKNGVLMENKREFDSSWDRSSGETRRMLDYFQTRKPHPVKSTTSLNGTRNLIIELTKPMAEISKLIRVNIGLAEDAVKSLQNAKLSGDRLRTKLHPEKTLMRQVPLDKPRTVCSDASCIEHKDDGTGSGTMLVDYPRPCHAVCYLTNVTPEVRADPALLKCYAFSGKEDCHQCGHNWTMHLHFLYELETYQTTIKDLGIEQQLKDHASDLELKRSAIANRKQLIDEYGKEHQAIRVAAAKFGLFMKEKSILPYNDATVAYLDMLIESEQAKVDAGGGQKNKDTLQSLQDDKQKHIELVNVLEESMQDRGGPKKVIEQDEVNQIVNQLYNLKHFGRNLEDLQTDIAYTHARTNRENPHRVRARNTTRRGGHGIFHSYSSNNPFRKLYSNAVSQARGENTPSQNPSVAQYGFSTGTMRTHQQQRPASGSYGSDMPGGFHDPASMQLAVRPRQAQPNRSSNTKSSWRLSSLNPFK